MQTKGPVRDLSGQPSDLRILPRSLSRVRLATRQKVKVEHAPDDVILECGSSVGGLVVAKLDIHPRRAEEEHGMGAGGAVLEVHRVNSVQVRIPRDAVRVACP